MERVSDIKPIIGHCNKEGIQQYKKWAKKASNEFNEGEMSIQNAIVDYLQVLFKNTASIITQYSGFSSRLKKVNEIIIFGWSTGDVDIPYLKKIKESLGENATWKVYWFDDKVLHSLKMHF